ncbi:MAG: geranylgeranylglyceryl/heptaprenylglyceryl phosphate synthase [Candidatus Hadarchaeum sp.]|uniref:geranylgeranylglyceryl/heptaprenylglyceryl phosphate synthase n=1 Tax=Candidatus Hadarchaeum sp. TaxID=2883567 RepID=UPI00317CB61D
MKVEERLRRIISLHGAAHLTLIDPEKQSPEEAGKMAWEADAAGTDGIMVGGSTRAGGKRLDDTVISIKENTDLPVILFPANETGISAHADAIFFMSMLNSRDTYYITGAQRLGAPVVKKLGLEPISMAYLVVEPGGAVGRVGKAELIPRDDKELAVAYALAAQFFGMRLVYLEAGSGADRPVPVEMIRAVRKATDVILIVGGGIKTPEAAAERVRAGADIIVTGTLVEQSVDRHARIKEIVTAIKAARTKKAKG